MRTWGDANLSYSLGLIYLTGMSTMSTRRLA